MVLASSIVALLMAMPLAANTSFVSGRRAVAMAKDGALVLDARGQEARAPYARGAVLIDWLELRERGGRSGLLMRGAEDLRRQLAALGIDGLRPVVVYGGGKSTRGADARIWWTLRYAGVTDVVILDGGIDAWIEAKGATVKTWAEPDRVEPISGPTFPNLRVLAGGVFAALETKDHTIVDVRTKEEFEGTTPRQSPRGGHVPTAVNLDYDALFDSDGGLLRASKIAALVAGVGIEKTKPTIVYSTDGTRAAFLMAVLMGSGYDKVALYDGSWFEWSADSKMPVVPVPPDPVAAEPAAAEPAAPAP